MSTEQTSTHAPTLLPVSLLMGFGEQAWGAALPARSEPRGSPTPRRVAPHFCDYKPDPPRPGAGSWVGGLCAGGRRPPRSPQWALTRESCVPGSVSLPHLLTPLPRPAVLLFFVCKVVCGTSFLEIVTGCGLRSTLCGHSPEVTQAGPLRATGRKCPRFPAHRETGRLCFLADLPVYCVTLLGSL